MAEKPVTIPCDACHHPEICLAGQPECVRADSPAPSDPSTAHAHFNVVMQWPGPTQMMAHKAPALYNFAVEVVDFVNGGVDEAASQARHEGLISTAQIAHRDLQLGVEKAGDGMLSGAALFGAVSMVVAQYLAGVWYGILGERPGADMQLGMATHAKALAAYASLAAANLVEQMCKGGPYSVEGKAEGAVALSLEAELAEKFAAFRKN